MNFPTDMPPYPRVYRLAPGWAAFLLVFGTAAIVGGGAGVWYFATGHQARSPEAAMVLAGLCVLVIAFGVYVTLETLKSRVVLYADRIEVYDWLRARALRRDQILGRRLQQAQNAPASIVLVPRGQERKLTISNALRLDQDFRNWIESLPDLDAQERRASEEEILGGPENASARQERVEGLARAQRLAKRLTWATFALAAWAWFYPQPYWLAMTVLIVLPWAALVIAARSQGLFRIDQRKNDVHPSVAVAFFMPGLVLTLRVLTDIHPLAWKAALNLTLGACVVLCVAAAMIDASLRAKPLGLAVIFLLSLAYGYGGGMEADALLDHAPAALYSANVAGKHVSSGRSTTYHLRLAPWGPQDKDDDVIVSPAVYRAVRTGDSVCLALKPGALGVAWYVVDACR